MRTKLLSTLTVIVLLALVGCATLPNPKPTPKATPPYGEAQPLVDLAKADLAKRLSLLGSTWAACTTEGSLPVISPSDEAAIYSTIIRRIYVEDDTFGGMLQPSTLYIIRYTNDKAGDPAIQSSESVLLSESVQSEITTALQDLPTKVVWVDTSEDMELDPQGDRVTNNGAIITLGNIHLQKDGSIHVAGSIYVANLAAGGQTYILKQMDGVWTIIGNTGVQWISYVPGIKKPSKPAVAGDRAARVQIGGSTRFAGSLTPKALFVAN